MKPGLSLQPDAPAAELPLRASNDAERRAERRQLSRTSLLSLRTGSEIHAFQLKNLSSRGASGTTAAALATGTRVALIFDGGVIATGTVRWARQGAIGMSFAFPLPAAVIRAHVEPVPHKDRAPRYRTARGARVRVDDSSRLATIHNLSEGGAEIEMAFPLKPGQRMTLECQGVLPIECEVRWSRGRRMGLKFLSYASLGQFMTARG